MIKGNYDIRARRRYILLAVLLLPVLSYLLIAAVYSGMAYVNQYRLNATLDQWAKNNTTHRLDEWADMEILALTALDGNERNVEIINALGRLYYYRSTRMEASRKQRLVFGHKAMFYYRQVNRLRPAWPYGWMNLAWSKARLGEVDQEFKLSLQQLLRLGPWESNTLPGLIQLSLYAWPYLDKLHRQAILEYFFVAQKKRKRDVQKALTESSQLTLYCAIVSGKGEKASFCP